MNPRQYQNSNSLNRLQQPIYDPQPNKQTSYNTNYQNVPSILSNYSNIPQTYNANHVNQQACFSNSQNSSQNGFANNIQQLNQTSFNTITSPQVNNLNNQVPGQLNSNFSQTQLYNASRTYIPSEPAAQKQEVFGLVSNRYAQASYSGYYNQWNSYCSNNVNNSGSMFAQTHGSNIYGATSQPVLNQARATLTQNPVFYNSNQNSVPRQNYVPGLAGTIDTVIRAANTADADICASFANEGSLKDNLPLTFKLYLEKCFKLCVTEKEQEETASYFKSLMFKILKDKSVHTVNWTAQPVPEFLRNNVFKLKGKGNEKEIVKIQPKANKRKFVKPKSMGCLPLNKDDKTNRQNKFKIKIDNRVIAANLDESYKDAFDASQHIVGTSSSLEKQYLRLTSAPDPSSIRPLRVLEESFNHVIAKWKKERNYHFVCEQLKSIRQDITIQAIKNDFVVKVYEKHAKLAISSNDIHEFNQCQNCLRTLYTEGFKGNEVEFIGYRLLYYMYTEETIDVMNLFKYTLNKFNQEKVLSCIKKLYKSWITKNYYNFFRLYKQLMHKKYSRLIDYFIERERLRSLNLLLKSFYPVININQLIDYTGFNSADDVITWLEQKGIQVEKGKEVLSCKYITGVLDNNE